MAQKCQIVWLLWTLISQAWNGLLRHFQCLKSSAGHWLAIEKGPRSIAPQGAELWPFKEGYRQLNFSKIGDKTLICVQTLVSQAWSGVLQKFKNLEPSEWSALAMKQAPRTVAPLEGKLQLDRVGKRHRIFTNFGKNDHISGLKWTFSVIQKAKIISMECSCLW